MAKKPLSRSSIEASSGLILAIIASVFVMTWWLKAILIIALAGIIVDLIIRSPWTIQWHWLLRSAVSFIALLLLIVVSWNPVKDQWIKDHPIKENPPLIKTLKEPVAKIPEPVKKLPPIKSIKKEDIKKEAMVLPNLNIDAWFNISPPYFTISNDGPGIAEQLIIELCTHFFKDGKISIFIYSNEPNIQNLRIKTSHNTQTFSL